MSNVAAENPPIYLKTTLPDTLETVQLERYVTVAGNDVRRRARVPVITNEVEPELACRVYDEFRDVCAQERLNLTSGTLKFEFWRQCLAGQARNHWDAVVEGLPGTTNANFATGIGEWFEKYMEPTAFHDQKQYFLNTTKAFAMSVKETASRVKQIVKFMHYMPNSPDIGEEIYSDTELKMTLYRLMRADWKTSFDASGADITEDDYTWERLVKYMASQERKEQLTRNRQGRGGRGGRSGGRNNNRGGGRNYSGGGRGGFHNAYNPNKRARYGYGVTPYSPQGRGYGYGGRGYYNGTGRGVYGASPGYQQYGSSSYGGRSANRGGRGFYRGGGRGRSSGRGRGGRGRGSAAYHSDNYAVENQGNGNTATDEIHQIESFDSSGGASAPHSNHGDNYYGENDGHWMHDDHFGVFDEAQFGYGDETEGYGDY